MKRMRRARRIAVACALILPLLPAPGCSAPESSRDPAALGDPLPSWHAGSSRRAIVDFVDRVTDPGGTEFVPASERIAVFDNDGTLWAERPVYFQLLFAVDRVRALANDHPEWRNEQPFRAVLEGDLAAVAASGEKGLLELVMATHAGMTITEFERVVADWIGSARHPERDVPYSDLLYQPMLELLDYLRANGFKIFIVSGGGIDFMRVFAEEAYGVPPEQIVGSSIATRFELRDGKPVIVRLPEIDFIDDKAGKPVGIQRHIGRRPIAAFGNSDGDFEMLQWATAGSGPRLGVLIHHTDSEREWAYDRDSHVGKLDTGLDRAAELGWVVVDMKTEWGTVFKP